jgi:uncharacterized phage infection (PIP) family protein YhgE
MIRLQKSEDNSPVQQEVMNAADKLGEQFTDTLWMEVGKEINRLIKKHNGLDQVLVISYLCRIITMTFIHGLRIVKTAVDEASDNEMTTQNLFEDLIEGLRFRLGFNENNKH